MTLADWMAERGVTDERMAELARADRTYIGRIRRGLKLPSMDLAARIKTVTDGDVTPDDFLRQAAAAE